MTIIEPRGSHAVHALRRKRAQIAGLIRDHERKARDARAALLHLDATLKLFDPNGDPEQILPKRVHRKSRYFDGPELARHCMDELRKAEGNPISAADIFDGAKTLHSIADKPFIRTALTERILNYLREKQQEGMVQKHGVTHDARWSLAPISSE